MNQKFNIYEMEQKQQILKKFIKVKDLIYAIHKKACGEEDYIFLEILNIQQKILLINLI